MPLDRRLFWLACPALCLLIVLAATSGHHASMWTTCKTQAAKLSWREELLRLLQWTEKLDTGVAVVLLSVLWVPWCVFCLPGMALSMGTGFVLGPLIGSATVALGSTFGATASFLVGRYLAKDWVSARVGGNRLLAKVQEGAHENGFRLCLLVRVIPLIPFNMLNYGLGLTEVSLRAYVFGSAIGMLPGAVINACLGSAVESLASFLTPATSDAPSSSLWELPRKLPAALKTVLPLDANSPVWKIVLVSVVLVALAAVLIVVTGRLIREQLQMLGLDKKALATPPCPSSPPATPSTITRRVVEDAEDTARDSVSLSVSPALAEMASVCS